MSNENHTNYIKAISKGPKLQRNIENDILSVSLDEQSLKLIKDIKSFMEWDVDTAINSAITYFYKTGESDDVKDNDVGEFAVKK